MNDFITRLIRKKKNHSPFLMKERMDRGTRIYFLNEMHIFELPKLN